MTDILEEILHEQSDAKKLRYFKRLLPIVILLTIIVVICMLVNNWYSNKEAEYNRRMGDILVKSISLNNNEVDLTLKSLQDLKASHSKISELALLKEVGIKITNKDKDGAKTLLEKIINNKHDYGVTSSYARLCWLSLAIDEPKLSNIENEKFKKYLDHFSDENKEFYGTANILKAFWYIKNSQVDLAKDLLKKIISLPKATKIVKEQAKALLSNLERQD